MKSFCFLYGRKIITTFLDDLNVIHIYDVFCIDTAKIFDLMLRDEHYGFIDGDFFPENNFIVLNGLSGLEYSFI